MNFYFQFIIPNRSFIEIGRIAPILSNIDDHFSDYVGDYWEKLCRETVSGNEIDGVTYGIARRWWGNVSREERIEIDVVAESLDKRYLLVGECKWSAKENSDRLLIELKKKAEKLPFAKSHTIIPKLFLKSRPTGTMENVLLPDDVMTYQQNKGTNRVKPLQREDETVDVEQCGINAEFEEMTNLQSKKSIKRKMA